MRKVIMASVAASMMAAVPMPTVAQEPIVLGPYQTRGDCQSYLMELRNEMRKGERTRTGGSSTKDLSGSDWNEWARTHFECAKRGGAWYITAITSG